MQKFWEKTKKSMTVGINVAMDATGASKIEEDPEYVEMSEKICQITNQAKNLHKMIDNFIVDAHKYALSQSILSSAFTDGFYPEDGPVYANSRSGQACSESFLQHASNMTQIHIKTQVLEPIVGIEEQIAQLTEVIEKRRNNLILMKNAESKLEKARAKKQQSEITPLEEEAAHRRSKYTQYHSEYMASARDIESKRIQIFSKAFNSYQFYIMELYERMSNKMNDELTQFPFHTLKDELPNITQDK